MLCRSGAHSLKEEGRRAVVPGVREAETDLISVWSGYCGTLEKDLMVRHVIRGEERR